MSQFETTQRQKVLKVRQSVALIKKCSYPLGKGQYDYVFKIP
jgi:hypothetical protein